MERLSASSYVPTKLTINEPDPMSRPSSVAPSIGKGKGKVDDFYNSAIHGMLMFMFMSSFRGFRRL